MKVIITGVSNVDKLAIAKRIVELDDDLEIAYTFISDSKYDNHDLYGSNYLYFLNQEDVNLSYKNNALLYVRNLMESGREHIKKGITMDQFYNADIMTMNIDEFNLISDNIFNTNDIIIIWVDTKNTKGNKDVSKDMMETKYLIERLDNINYMYFLDEDADTIANAVLAYMHGDTNLRAELLEENS